MKPYDIEWEMSGTYRVYAENEESALLEFDGSSAYEIMEDGFTRPESYYVFEVDEEDEYER